MKRVGCGTLLLLACSVGTVYSQEPSRADAFKAFRELREQTQSAFAKENYGSAHIAFGAKKEVTIPVYSGGAVPYFKGVSVGEKSGGNAKLIVKVWAVPLDEDGRLTKTNMHLGKYRWSPKQRLAVFFDTAVPVQVGFYQDFDNKPSERVLPDKAFPESFRTVKPGEPYRFPVDIELDDSPDDELMSIVVVAAGSEPNLPPPANKMKVDKITGDKYVVFSQNYSTAFERLAKEARKEIHRPKFRAAPSTPNLESSPDADDVALVMYGTETFGHVQIRLRKKQ